MCPKTAIYSSPLCSVPAVSVKQDNMPKLRAFACPRSAMLRRMSPEHRFGTAARLSAEVLGGVADEALALDACGEVLGDALRILTSEHIKVRLLKRLGVVF